MTSDKLNKMTAVADQRREPTPGEKEAAVVATARRESRLDRVQVAMTNKGSDQYQISSPHSDEAGTHFQLLDAVGTSSPAFADYAVTSLANIARSRGQEAVTETQMNAALAMLDGYKPENEMEAMLVAQVFTCFDVGMDMARRAKQSSSREMMDSCMTASTKMMRTLNATVDTLSKLRRGGSQTVRVEHVHVYNGGQAIVGNVGTGGGAIRKKGGQSHAAKTVPQAATATVSLSGSNAAGPFVQIPVDAEWSMPDARRDKPRRAQRQSKRVEARRSVAGDDRDAAEDRPSELRDAGSVRLRG
ncbi:hypothetical protein [Sphingomonas paeninsulae]|uniref:hypothetical protein n=1 Tax=Sphingomonas paeninsulae TaxID=2319844 RepID=UPI0013CF20FC|nr:hypothetical protein [Sphingomonas paeninsulae]